MKLNAVLQAALFVCSAADSATGGTEGKLITELAAVRHITVTNETERSATSSAVFTHFSLCTVLLTVRLAELKGSL
jgi:hypothetical protein